MTQDERIAKARRDMRRYHEAAAARYEVRVARERRDEEARNVAEGRPAGQIAIWR